MFMQGAYSWVGGSDKRLEGQWEWVTGSFNWEWTDWGQYLTASQPRIASAFIITIIGMTVDAVWKGTSFVNSNKRMQ